MSDSSSLPFLVYLLTLRNAGGLEHSDAVAVLAVALGRRAGLDSEFLQDLEFAGRVHDIGKLGIADAVMNKPGRFTRAERVMMQQHVPFGVEMLRLLDCGGVSPSITEMVRDHHENYDGSGYPNGAKGAEISTGGRLIRIADSFCAMTTSYRVYRTILTSKAARRVLRESAQHYDPDFLRIFLEMPL